MESGTTGGAVTMFPQLTWINALVMSAAGILAYVLWLQQKTWGLPPFPTLPLPIIGNLYHPGLFGNMAAQLVRWSEKVGGLYSMYVGSDLYIFVDGYDNVRDMLVTHRDKTSSRPRIYHRLDEEKVLGIAVTNGDEWKERRGHLMLFLRSLVKGKKILENFSKVEVQYLLKTLDDTNEKPVDFHPIILRNVFTLMFSFLIGEAYDVNSPAVDRLFAIVMQGRKMPIKAGLLSAFPWIRYIPFDPFYLEELKEVDEKFNAFSDVMIDRVKRKMEEESTGGFIESYLKAKSKKIKANKKTHLGNDDLMFTLEEMYFAGADTVSASLWWWCLQMVNFPEVQEKVFQEIKNTIGLEKQPTLEDRPRLKYTNALVFESLRRASVSSFTVPHSSSETFTFNGYTIPKGATILPYFKSIHQNDDYFGGNASEMKPERFIDDAGTIVRLEKSIPFSLGRRACPGENLAGQIMFYYIACMLQRFSIEPEDPNNLPSMDGSHDGIVDAPADFNVKFVRRCPNIN